MSELKQTNLEKDNNEILSIYNNLLKFALEYYEADEEELRSYYNIQDKKCYNILQSLIKLKRINLLKFLDYSFIYYNCGNNLKRYPIETINDYINRIIQYYEYDKEIFMDNFFGENTCVIETINDLFFDELLESNYVDNNYKKIIQLFSSIFIKNSELIDNGYYDEYDVDIYINYYLNAVFFYLVSNNYIKEDFLHVCNFLNYIYNNIEKVLDEINISGIKNDKDLFCYIDHEYKSNNSKLKTIK